MGRYGSFWLIPCFSTTENNFPQIWGLLTRSLHVANYYSLYLLNR